MKHATKKLLVRSMIATVLICALTVAGIAVYASESTFRVEGDPLVYTVWGDKVYVTDCDPGYTSITIPGTVNGYPVTAISWAFNDYDTLETLTFADDSKVRNINDSFDGCDNLTTINWGESGSLKVIDNAFDYCIGLEELTIPSSVQTIENWSFENCLNLKKLTFEEGSQLTKIGKCAFRYDLDDDTIVPATITSLTLPASLEELGAGAFNYVPVEHFALEDGSKLEAIPNGFLAAEGADGQPGVITSPTVLEAIERLVRKAPEAAAKACASLVSIDLGENNSLIWIGDGAFKNQIYLTDINLGESVREEGLTIEKGAFVAAGNSAGIETLVLPANLTEIGERAFIHARIENLVFSDNCKLTEIPDGFMAIHGIGNNGRPGQNRIDSDTIHHPAGSNEYVYEFVKDSVQIAANSLKTVDFGKNNSLTQIGSGAFYNQSHMTAIDFGTSSASLKIENGAFIGVGNNGYLFENKIDAKLHEGIETLVFPANLAELGAGSFDEACIKNIVFSDNCQLTTIPSSFMGLDNYGYNGYPGALDTERKYVSGNITYVHKFMAEWAQIAANSLKTVDFGDNNHLTRIGEGAFKNQSHMTAIDFGTAAAGVKLTIAGGAFIGVGNNGYLYQNGIDKELNEGIETLVFPANLVLFGSYYSEESYYSAGGAFAEACIKNIVFSDNCKLKEIPDHFMGLSNYGNNGRPGQSLSNVADSFVTDWTQIAANSLETIDFGENNSLEKIGRGAFYNQSHMTSIDFGTPGQNQSLVIAGGAFIGVGNNGYLYQNGIDKELNEGIETLVFPANLVLFGSYYSEESYYSEGGAFAEACIKNIVFSDNCKLKEIPGHFMGLSNYGNNGRPGQSRLDDADSFVTDWAQICANSLETIDFGENNSLEKIGGGAFYNQSHMTSIDFGTPGQNQSLVIADGAFIGVGNNGYLYQNGIDKELNEGIETLVFPANLSSLNPGAFDESCIKNIVFSDNCQLTQIPYGFMGLTNAGDNGHPGRQWFNVETDEFWNIVSFEHAFVLDYAQICANSLETVDFGENNSLTQIGSGAFYNQSHMKSIDFGTSTVDLRIDAGAFIGVGNNGYLVEQGIDEELNDGIETLVFPANLVEVVPGWNENDCIFDLANIKHIKFSEGCKLETIPSGFMQVPGPNGEPRTELAYVAANSLESVDFGKNNSITTIRGGAFTNQTNLKSVDFGTNDTLKTFNAGVFSGNKSLQILDLSGTEVETIAYGAFNFGGMTEIILPSTMTTLNEGAFQHLTEMTILVIDDSWSITELEGGVFSHSESLTKVDLLNSNITTIGDSLKDNANLTSVIFPAKLESIVWDNTEDDEVCPFYGCGNVNRLYFASADPSGYTFTEGVFQFLNESGIVLVPDDTTDESIDAYKTLLTACGLSFEEGKWRIARQTLDTVEVTYEWNGAEGGVDSELFIAGDEFIAPVAPKYEGYNFDGWYADEALTVEWDMNSIITEDVTIYAKWSKKVTASVGGDNTESVVTPDVVIEDNKAALDVTDEEIQQIIENSKEDTTIIIDLSELDSDITAVEIPADLIEEITDSMNSEDTETEFLEIRTSDGSIVLDKTALETIADEIGEGMTVVLDEIDEDDLNEDQKAALEDMDVHGTYEASVSDSETEQSVTDLNGGKATLSVEFEIPEGYDADNFCVVSVGKDGQTETLTTWYENGKLYWEADSFSDFAIIYDEAIEDDEEEEQPEADSFDYELWLASVMMLRNQKFNISAAATEGGSITSEGNTSVKYDMSITYTITPDEGYEISAVLVDGVDVGAVSEYTFKNVRAAHTISAIFTKIN